MDLFTQLDYAPVYRVALVREERRVKLPSVDGPEGVADLLMRYLADVDREHFVVVMLDTQNNVIGLNTAHVGTLNSAAVRSADVFKPAVVANAAAIIVAHNHPGDDPTPSPEDRAVTDLLAKAGAHLDIPLLDHLVVTHSGGFSSFKRMGLMPN